MMMSKQYDIPTNVYLRYYFSLIQIQGLSLCCVYFQRLLFIYRQNQQKPKNHTKKS